MKITLKALALGTTMLFSISTSVFASDLLVTDGGGNSTNGIVTEVINQIAQNQDKTGIFNWYNVGSSTTYYRSLTYTNSYTFTTDTTYSAVTGNMLLYHRTQYTNYSYYSS